MTEKRFILVKCVYNNWGLIDRSLEDVDQLVLIHTSKSSVSYLVNILNQLNDDNEQLKQFQDRVFSWIDMHLQRLPTLIDEEFNSDDEFADPSLYSGALQILETMKKELKGDV